MMVLRFGPTHGYVTCGVAANDSPGESLQFDRVEACPCRQVSFLNRGLLSTLLEHARNI
jgi:hypothetical protein